MTTTYNCTADDERTAGLAHARRAILEKKCVVFPTDTVYGIAADAFSPQAVTMLLVSKGRGRNMPPPVLIPRLNALMAWRPTCLPRHDSWPRPSGPGD